MNYPEWVRPEEAKVMDKLLTAILTLAPVKLVVRVYDGEEWATEWTDNRATIKAATASTDETRWAIASVSDTGAFRRVGTFLLIHGNGEDVIADASWNPKDPNHEGLINALFDEALK